ncbi:MAG: DUF3892 domain-containing protein [Pseudomonadota bacterium]
MAIPTLDIQFRATGMQTIQEGDGSGMAEPYLWTVFLKFDGDTITQRDDDPFRLAGTPGFAFGQGSHNNLIGTPVDAGMPLLIPQSVGTWNTSLRSMRFDILGEAIELPGVIAAILILMEENAVTDAAIEVGHQKLNAFIQTEVTDFIHALDLLDVFIKANERADFQNIPIEAALRDELIARFEGLKERLVGDAEGVIREAVTGEQGFFENLASFFDGDELIDAELVFFDQSQLAEAMDQEIPFEVTLRIEGVFPQGGGLGGDGEPHYTLHGHVRGEQHMQPIKDNDLPAAPRLEVSCVRKRWSKTHRVDYITTIGGTHEGTPWRATRPAAIALIKSGLKTFFTRSPDGSETEIRVRLNDEIGHEFLATDANNFEEDNLLSLGHCEWAIAD